MQRAKGRRARRLKARAARNEERDSEEWVRVKLLRNAENCYRKADEAEAHGAQERAMALRERAKGFEVAARMGTEVPA
jgi:hypothetical protein